MAQPWISQKWIKLVFKVAIGLTLLLGIAHWEVTSYQQCRMKPDESFDIAITPPPRVFKEPYDHVQDLSAGNSTLGFAAILALSQGTPWRVAGLHAAANASGIQIQIPEQPEWSVPFVNAFQIFGPIEAHGAAKAWLGHIDLLKYIIQNRWGSAVILEDDIDWSVDIRTQTAKISKAVVKLTKQKTDPYAPYGLDWDVMWMGHCSDPLDAKKPHVDFSDETVAPLKTYRGLNPHVTTVLKEQHRTVHFSINPVCTFGYAVTNQGAKRLLHLASQGRGGAFDLMMMHACQNNELRCISVNPEIFDAYHPAEGDESEVRAGDRGGDFKPGEGFGMGGEMGHSDNILRSARCNGQWQSDCMTNYKPPKPDAGGRRRFAA